MSKRNWCYELSSGIVGTAAAWARAPRFAGQAKSVLVDMSTSTGARGSMHQVSSEEDGERTCSVQGVGKTPFFTWIVNWTQCSALCLWTPDALFLVWILSDGHCVSWGNGTRCTVDYYHHRGTGDYTGKKDSAHDCGKAQLHSLLFLQRHPRWVHYRPALTGVVARGDFDFEFERAGASERTSFMFHVGRRGHCYASKRVVAVKSVHEEAVDELFMHSCAGLTGTQRAETHAQWALKGSHCGYTAAGSGWVAGAIFYSCWYLGNYVRLCWVWCTDMRGLDTLAKTLHHLRECFYWPTVTVIQKLNCMCTAVTLAPCLRDCLRWVIVCLSGSGPGQWLFIGTAWRHTNLVQGVSRARGKRASCRTLLPKLASPRREQHCSHCQQNLLGQSKPGWGQCRGASGLSRIYPEFFGGRMSRVVTFCHFGQEWLL